MKAQSLQKLKLVVPKQALIENHPENLQEPQWKDYFNMSKLSHLSVEEQDDFMMEAKYRHDVDMAAYVEARRNLLPDQSYLDQDQNDDSSSTKYENQMHPGMMLDMFAKPIVINPAFAAITQSALASLLLSYLAYESEDLAPEYEGWVHKTTDEWTEWTGMSRFEQTSARKILTGLNITQECRAGMPAKLYMRINFEYLYSLLDAHARIRYAHISF